MDAGSASVDETMVRIRRYLDEHPNAADTLQGIALWWLYGNPGRAWLETVERAMDRLSAAGVATKRTLGDGNRDLRAQPGSRSALNVALPVRAAGTDDDERGVPMPATLTYPGVYIEEIPSGVRTITGVATSIALFLGWAARGRADRAVRIHELQAIYERAFGGLDRRSPLVIRSVSSSNNGGSDAYVIGWPARAPRPRRW